MDGKVNYLAGLAAEDQVARDYQRRGLRPAARRWRGSHGEIDLVMADEGGFVFVEVKKSKTHAQAAARLGRAQLGRICASAMEYVAQSPDGGRGTMRIDVALVDAMGRIDILENVTMAA